MAGILGMNIDVSQLGQTASRAGMIIVIIIAAVIVGAAIFFALYYMRLNREFRKYSVVIWKRYTTQDGRTIPMLVDIREQGRVMFDKKVKKWVFHLRRRNLDLGEEELASHDEDRELDLPTVPFLKGGQALFIEELGKRKYGIGKPFVVDGQVRINVTSADLAEAVRSYDINAKTYGKKQSPWLAFAIYVTFAALILILVIVVLNKIEILQQFGDKWLEGAKLMASGSAVSSGTPG